MARRLVTTGLVALVLVALSPLAAESGPPSMLRFEYTDGGRTFEFCIDVGGAHEWFYNDSEYDRFYGSAESFSFDPVKGKGKGKAKDDSSITGDSAGPVPGKMQASFKLGGKGKAKIKVGTYKGSFWAESVLETAGTCL